jgi:hypothetical protein
MADFELLVAIMDEMKTEMKTGFGGKSRRNGGRSGTPGDP